MVVTVCAEVNENCNRSGTLKSLTNTKISLLWNSLYKQSFVSSDVIYRKVACRLRSFRIFYKKDIIYLVPFEPLCDRHSRESVLSLL